MSSNNTVLVVDLDNTLIRTDLLHESVLQFVSNNYLNIARLPRYLLGGKAAFKSRIAAHTNIDAATLPYRDEALALISEARRHGRKVILVSASDQKLVDAVAQHLGCFDEAHGSDGNRNLGGATKAEFLVNRFGEKKFDYAADAPVDLAVWARANQAITFNVSHALRAAVARVSDDVRNLCPPTGIRERVRYYAAALRPHQWLKNILVFLPVIAAHRFEQGALTMAIFAFIIFSLTASSVYILNDLLDLSADRKHPRKSKRPFAAGLIPIAHGVGLTIILLFSAVILCVFFATPDLFLTLGIYYFLTLLYSLELKRYFIIDIFVLAALYTLRVVAGAAATDVILSPWMLAFSGFLFLSLAAVKRQIELVDKKQSGGSNIWGRNYGVEDLPVITMMAMAAGYNSVLVLALYISSPEVLVLYASPYLLWFACPILLYWISRIILIAQRGNMNDDPVVFAVSDKISIACGVAVLLCGIAGTFL